MKSAGVISKTKNARLHFLRGRRETVAEPASGFRLPRFTVLDLVEFATLWPKRA